MRALASIAVLASLASPLSAAAQSACEPGEAGLRFDEAHDAYEDDDLALAATLLERSIGCEETPEALYDLYVVREQQQEWALAADALETYLESEPPLLPERRRDLEGWLAELRDRDHPRPEPERPFDIRGDQGWQIGSGITLGVGLATILAFGVTGSYYLAYRAQNCGTPPCEPSVAATLDQLEVASWTTLGIGAALTGVGLVLTLVSGSWSEGATRTLPPSLDPSRLQWQPITLNLDVGPGSVQLRGRF